MARQRKKAGILSMLFLGIIFTASGAAVVHFFGHDIYLEGSRDTGVCEITRVGLLGKSEVVESFPVDRLQGATVLRSKTSDGDSTYKVIIETQDGSIPLTGYASSGRSKHDANADKINAFAKGQSDVLSIKQSGTGIRIVGLLFAGIGLLMLLGFVWMLIKLVLALVLLAVSR